MELPSAVRPCWLVMNAPLVLRDSFSVNDEITGGLGKTNGLTIVLVLRFVKLLTCGKGFEEFEGLLLSLDISIQSGTIFL